MDKSLLVQQCFQRGEMLTRAQPLYRDCLTNLLSWMLAADGVQRIILVTSAAHMPRSLGLFLRQGFEVIPAPTDYTVTQADWEEAQKADLPARLIDLLPSANNLSITTRMLKEYIGLFIYKLQGWL
jgi:uncharacterized SAM-binding protein YcdF (DUF218 family)